MTWLISGIVVLGVTLAVFISLLPRGEKLHRWADTAWEPYVAVALCSGVALGATMTLSALIGLFG